MLLVTVEKGCPFQLLMQGLFPERQFEMVLGTVGLSTGITSGFFRLGMQIVIMDGSIGSLGH